MIHETHCEDVGDLIACAIDMHEAEMTAAQRKAINLCNESLYGGPLYFDENGGQCSCFDEGAKAHDFSSDLAIVRDWAESIDDVKVEVAYDDESGESFYERADGSARDIIRRILGRELASML